MIAFLHVLGICLQDARIGAGLGKHFPEHSQVQTQRGPQAQAFRKARRVDVHHHVHQGFDLRGSPCFPHVTQGTAELFENGFPSLISLRLAANHQI